MKRYLQKVRSPPEEDCTICMEALPGPSGYKGPGVGGIQRAESVGRLAQCGHQYHLQCLVAMYNNGNKVRKGIRASACYGINDTISSYDIV